ncbi:MULTISPECIES: SusD/RagB family nutrient-binding outer membrane lipoprotein [unclassified Carboxylicivirga]|uniref:SusD/RagB family nutrient-binding outer membrane lipoprotein n=1 Tax=Carboxylicivirga TaxID=1628153 RepID=UPI003D33457D
MKYLYKISVLLLAIIAIACTKDFEEINFNPNKNTEINDEYQFAYSQLAHVGGNMYYALGSTVLPLSGLGNHIYPDGQAFRDLSALNGYWNTQFTTTIKNLADLRSKLQVSNENNQNDAKLAQVKILKAITLHRLTDIFGDIPYKEAGKGFVDGVLSPKYDNQKDVYAYIIADLQEARTQLESGTPFTGKSDLMYAGDITKWQKFVNSYLMRVGMRMVNVNAEEAKKVVSDAISHSAGVMTSLDDDATVSHEELGGAGIHINQSAAVFSGYQRRWEECFVGEPFVREMQDTKDARIFWVASQYVKSSTAYDIEAWEGQIDYNPFIKGAHSGEPYIPNVSLRTWRPDENELGDLQYITVDVADLGELANANIGIKLTGFSPREKPTTPEEAEFLQYNCFAAVNPTTFGNVTNKSIIMSYDEVCFLLAEAAHRWQIGGDVKSNYENGIRACFAKYPKYLAGADHVERMIAKYNQSASDNLDYEASVEEYLQHPAIVWGAKDAMEQIVLERWKALFPNGFEAWALWRRTKLPKVVVENFPMEEFATFTPEGEPITRLGLPFYVPVYYSDPEEGFIPGFEGLVPDGWIPGVGYPSNPVAYIPWMQNAGGVTEGYRAERAEYPPSELAANGGNVFGAMERQREANPSVGPSNHWYTVKMWWSK